MSEERPLSGSGDESPPDENRVPCPNCCRLAFVVRHEMGLRHYWCELCLAEGAVPAGDDPARD